MKEHIQSHCKAAEAMGVSLLLAALLGLSLSAVFRSTPTADEPAHISAGYGYTALGDARLNIEHPPILKAISAIITSSMKDINFPTSDFKDIKTNFWGVQWKAGSDYIYAPGNSPTKVLFLSRFPMAVVALLLGVVVYLWAKRLYGIQGGFLALLFYCFSPSILGHAPLITTDIGVSFGFLASLFSYSGFLDSKEKTKNIYAILTVVFVAFLFLAKFSAFLILPILFIMPLIKIYFQEGNFGFTREKFSRLVKQILVLGLFLIISATITYLVYLFFMRNMPADIYKKEIWEVFRSDRYGLGSRLSNLPTLLRPLGYYLAGFVYVAKHSVNGHLSYFLGNLSVKGTWNYFPLIFFFKTQLVWWVAFCGAIFASIKIKKLKFDEIILLLFALIYMASSMKSALNIGIRHIFPAIVVLFIFSAKVVTVNIQNNKARYLALGLLILFYVLPTMIAYPHFISYTNATIPSSERYKYFGDSSLDWGQDLYRLKEYVSRNNIENLKVDYFGGNIPVNYYLPDAELWSGKQGIPGGEGYIAISATNLQFSPRYGEAGKQYFNYFMSQKPITQIGNGSILLYSLKNSLN